MAQPIKVTILGDVQDLVAKLGKGEQGVGAFASSVARSAADVAKSAAGFAAAGLAAGGLGGALVESLDRGKITAALGGALGATADEAKRYGQAAGSLYAKGYGENFAEVSTAIEAVISSLGKLSGQAEIESVSKKALDLASVFKVDLNEAVASAGILMKTGLARDAVHAFDLMSKGLQGVPAAVRDDLLEASDEYSVFFQGLGFTGEEAFGVLAQAAKGGKIQLDKAADALKEFRIRSVDMQASSVAAYQAIGLDAATMARRILAGGADAKAAFSQILTGITSIQDPVKRETAAVGLFGTQFEDLGNIDALAALNPMHSALSNVGGAADALGKSLHENASANIDAFVRSVSAAFVDLVGGKVVPAISSAVSWIRDNWGPALNLAGSILTGVVIPAVVSLARFVDENGTAIGVVAGIITALFLPALIASGVQATIAGAKNVAAWVATQLAASQAALASVVAGARVVGAWVAQSGAAALHAGFVVRYYATLAASAVTSAATTAGAWVAAQARTLASLAVTAAGFVAQGAAMATAAAVTAAKVVAGWVLMGVESLIQGARMAAAWVLAMGPVGWIIAAVVALVALIIANWDTVVDWTQKAWTWLVDAIVAAGRFIWDYFLKWSLVGLIITYWDEIVAGVRAAVNWVLDAVGWIGQLPGRVGGWFASVYTAAVGKLNELLGWLRGLPGSILSALGDLGSLLVNAGRDLLSGLWSGIQGMAGWLRGKLVSFFGSLVPDWAKSALGIASPSRVFAAIGRWIPPGIADGITGNAGAALGAVSGLATAMASELSGTDFGSPLAFALAGAGTAAVVAGTRGEPGGPGGVVPGAAGGSGPAQSTGTTVNVFATTNADPNRIGSEVAWAVRNTGR
ncbi:MAG: hypothetical protein ABIQ18_35870 [Umezawaea sp.]